MRKTALLTGVAGLFLMTAPAFAQDSTAPQTPASPQAAEQPRTLQLQPGAAVNGSDGAPIGTLEGVRNGASGQELTVRGADGVLRGVPTSGGVEQDGDGVKVGWTAEQFSAAPAIDAPAEPAMPAEPATPPEASPPVTAPEPPTPAEPTPPSSPEPAPGEGQTSPDA
ncbi:superoxide dismutase [Brevundimonas sp. FT23028]|uniref:superoxide dismutase n=1 Tax=Brevundimonas sp. FT23028 TaxID=3393748 RepID=UPI003B5877FA